MLLIFAEISQRKGSSAPTSFQTGGRTIPSCPPGQAASEKTITKKCGVNVPCERNFRRGVDRKPMSAATRVARRAKRPVPRSPRQSPFAKIFYFTEIRNCGIRCASRPEERGDRTSQRTWVEVRWTRLRRACEAGPGRDEPREVQQRADGRRQHPAKPLGEAGSCVRRKRVVLTVVATVKPCGDGSGPNRVSEHRQFARRRRPERTRLRGERA